MNPNPSLRIVLATVGSRGDVQPMLALAKAFVAHGHVPLIAAPSGGNLVQPARRAPCRRDAIARNAA